MSQVKDVPSFLWDRQTSQFKKGRTLNHSLMSSFRNSDNSEVYSHSTDRNSNQFLKANNEFGYDEFDICQNYFLVDQGDFIDEDHKFLRDPRPEDLCDLFNFAFTKKNSCFAKDKYTTSQSVYLFLQKFGGNQGLIKYLKSSFDDIKLLNQPNRCKESTKVQRKVDFLDKKRGITADREDKKWRVKHFGKNIYP